MDHKDLTERRLYTTQLCRFYLDDHCNMYENCKFAHSLGGLRALPQGFWKVEGHFWQQGQRLRPSVLKLIHCYWKVQHTHGPQWAHDCLIFHDIRAPSKSPRSHKQPRPPSHSPPASKRRRLGAATSGPTAAWAASPPSPPMSVSSLEPEGSDDDVEAVQLRPRLGADSP